MLWLLTSPHHGSLVVRAPCETCARSQGAVAAGAEGPMVWRDPAQSSVKRVEESGKSGVVCDGRK